MAGLLVTASRSGRNKTQRTFGFAHRAVKVAAVLAARLAEGAARGAEENILHGAGRVWTWSHDAAW